MRSLDRGLWALAERPITEVDIVAAFCRRDRDTFAAGLSAARFWGIPLPGVLADEVVPVDGVDRLGAGIDLGQPDLHWSTWRVALEHDGPTHLTPEQQAKDIARGERRARAGWVEVRTTAEDLQYGCRTAVDRVRDALLRQGLTASA